MKSMVQAGSAEIVGQPVQYHLTTCLDYNADVDKTLFIYVVFIIIYYTTMRLQN